MGRGPPAADAAPPRSSQSVAVLPPHQTRTGRLPLWRPLPLPTRSRSYSWIEARERAHRRSSCALRAKRDYSCAPAKVSVCVCVCARLRFRVSRSPGAPWPRRRAQPPGKKPFHRFDLPIDDDLFYSSAPFSGPLRRFRAFSTTRATVAQCSMAESQVGCFVWRAKAPTEQLGYDLRESSRGALDHQEEIEKQGAGKEYGRCRAITSASAAGRDFSRGTSPPLARSRDALPNARV